MGVENVKLVYGRWVHLPDRSFRLLAFMGLVSMDADMPPKFWGGREQMSYALGRLTPEEPAASDKSERAEVFRKARAADFEAVKTALRGIVKAGAASLDVPPAKGRNAVYALHLDAPTGKAEPAERGRTGLPTGKAEPAERGRLSLPPRREPPYGGFPTEEPQGSRAEPKSPLATNSLANPEENAVNYEIASEILGKLPDLGQSLLSRISAVEGMQNRVIAAAALALTENPTLMPREAS